MTTRSPEPRRAPVAWAVGVSLAVHGGLALLLLRAAPPVRGSPAPRPVRVTLLPVPAIRPPVVPAPPSRPDRAPPDTRAAPRGPREHPEPRREPDAPVARIGPSDPPATDGTRGAEAAAPGNVPRPSSAADAPLALFPEGAVARGAGPGPVAADSGGRTRPDGPGSRAEEGRVVQQRVQTWRLQAMGERQVAVGVDDYFRTVRHGLEDGLGTPPPEPGPRHGALTAGQRWVNAWLDALADADPARGPPRHEGERLPDMSGVQDVSGHVDETLRNHLGANAVQPSFVGDRLVRRALPTSPVAVLRIVQHTDGHVVTPELVASSGDRTFDAWVLEHAALAFGAMPPPPARSGAGLHPDGTRTEWAFWREDGRCKVLLLRAY